jgi:hypothetical protein
MTQKVTGHAQETARALGCRLLAPDHKTIPIFFKYDRWHTNIKIPPVVVTNETGSPVALTSVDIVGRHDGGESVRYRFHRKDLEKAVSETNGLLNRLSGDSSSPWKIYNLKKLFGIVPPSDRRYCETLSLHPSEQTCVDLNRLFCFEYDGPCRIRDLAVVFTADSGGHKQFVEFPIPLTMYQCKGDYIFPVTGPATVAAMPLGDGHRDAPSSEFAVDIISCRYLQDGQLSSSSPHDSPNAQDYFIFHRDVLAVGDGTVVELGRSWPDDWMNNPLDYSVERITDLTKELISNGVGFQNAYLGNYIIVDHGNGEYSAYVHLSQESVEVEVGDSVRQGQAIGLVGNTGNSTEPHLHFQLMDSPDYPSANGLPVMFRNLDVPLKYGYDFEQANTLTHSDYLSLSAARCDSIALR